ncbi:hypothetical protein LUX39_51160 [Actinomadura madurae]|nr:hypothetical protein [Actinomadura madurae]MCQ0020988.1 hypothetical protein [Actinomadura madurae]
MARSTGTPLEAIAADVTVALVRWRAAAGGASAASSSQMATPSGFVAR